MENPPAGIIMIVNLRSDGGSDGTSQTCASWTYAAHDLADRLVGRRLLPEKPRQNGKIHPAEKGIGYFDQSGRFVLSIAFEYGITGIV